MFYIFRSENTEAQEGLNILADTGFSLPGPLLREEALVNTPLSKRERSSPKEQVTPAVFYIMRVCYVETEALLIYKASIHLRKYHIT